MLIKKHTTQSQNGKRSGKDHMYDSNVQYNVVYPYILCIDDSLTNMGIVPLPDKNRIHPLDREFNKLIRNKLKLFISSSK